jgi:hypothetical protein
MLKRKSMLQNTVKLVLKCCNVKLYKGETCRCKEIKIIQNAIIYWIKHKSQNITHNTSIIYNDINLFTTNTIRANNDINNKKREQLIEYIINNKIPEHYYKSSKWKNLKNEINTFIKNICEIKNITCCNKIQCICKAGRGHHYDFKIEINDNIEIYVEFKFNADCVKDIPQFVSPMKPSQYLESCYEEYYYDNYLKEILEEYNLPLPKREEYLKQIHSTNPCCLKEIQQKYYSGCKKSSQYLNNTNDIEFYEKMKKISSESIATFISQNKLDDKKLTNYLLNTQKGKYYMLYKNNKIYLQTINQDDYIITSVINEPHKYRYVAITKTGKQINILLRWKNGNGIAYPAFQIS